MTQTFDAIIIGTGQAGPALAARLSTTGMTSCIPFLEVPEMSGWRDSAAA